MRKIEEKCKEKGVRLTDQRKIIAKVISDSKQTFGSKDLDCTHWATLGLTPLLALEHFWQL